MGKSNDRSNWRNPKFLKYKEKYLLLKRYFESGIHASDLATEAGVHVSTVYNWLHRIDYNFSNVENLRTPVSEKKRSGSGLELGALSDWVKSEILSLLKSHPEMGSLKIKQYFFRHHQLLLSQRHIYEFLKSEGIIAKRRSSSDSKPSGDHTRRFEYTSPLSAVQIDLLQFSSVCGVKLYLVTLLDDFSRFILISRFIAVKSMDEVIRVFRMAIKQWGLIEVLISDKGSEFVSWKSFTRFEQLLCDLDIELISCGPQAPWNIGKLERWHQSFRKEFESVTGPFESSVLAQDALDRYVNYYNYERPHQAIGGLVPADRFFGVSEELTSELSAIARSNKDKKIYFTCNIGNQRLVVSGVRDNHLKVYHNNEEKVSWQKD
jgi:putative transposase